MLHIYNTLTRRKEEFQPLTEGKVSIYCCGITPYNYAHIGNARPAVFWDVVRRYLKAIGYKVRYVQNFTDIDDKIIQRAKEENTTAEEIADRYIKIYMDTLEALNIWAADVYPKVSENMDAITEMIKHLVVEGYAYPLEGDVYYSVEKFKDYGKLSGRRLEDMEAGARVEVDDRKYNPMDFALWKAAKPGEPSWDSPWGKGRPGWHIECSALSMKYLGESFDMHGGGSDLIFPHHENEIAQSEAYIGHSDGFARYWLHNGFITIKEEKMSKSLGNVFLVHELLKRYSGEVIRYFILGAQYRSPLDFSDERVAEAQSAYKRLVNAKKTAEDLLENADGSAAGPETAKALLEKAKEAKKAFFEAMDDDFNTALAIGCLFPLIKEFNTYAGDVKSRGVVFDREGFRTAFDIFTEMTSILGILEKEEAGQADDALVEGLMGVLLSIRQDARAEKNWTLSDKIRDELKNIGIAIEDTPQGVNWKKL
ncbi:cysteine--tRNA ligase [Selenomonas sp. TAMA-11512]|uniref:cysteine--tRNA ligase n=1 Tax=Selenomonas sp. TAMA-11512 TaxID=3095337 RepID=UPI003084A2D8|nr:cysteine--tRNA ligase [Selenomonas sp. TAMA-11512]